MPESVDQKGRRYLVEGRLVVDRVEDGRVQARVRGGGAVYTVAWEAGEWSCSCPARSRCAHLSALELVVAPEGARV